MRVLIYGIGVGFTNCLRLKDNDIEAEQIDKVDGGWQLSKWTDCHCKDGVKNRDVRCVDTEKCGSVLPENQRPCDQHEIQVCNEQQETNAASYSEDVALTAPADKYSAEGSGGDGPAEMIGYGPEGCFSTFKDKDTGFCIVQTSCAGVDTTKFTLYEPGFLCEEKDGEKTTRKFQDSGKPAFGPSEVFNTEISCEKCLPLPNSVESQVMHELENLSHRVDVLEENVGQGIATHGSPQMGTQRVDVEITEPGPNTFDIKGQPQVEADASVASAMHLRKRHHVAAKKTTGHAKRVHEHYGSTLPEYDGEPEAEYEGGEHDEYHTEYDEYEETPFVDEGVFFANTD